MIAAQNTELQRRPDVVECWVNPGWHQDLTFEPHPDWSVNPSASDGTGGLATVMVVRPDQRSRSLVCVYLVDTFCLGVKNVIGPETVSNNRLPKLRYTVFAGYDELPVHAPLELAQHMGRDERRALLEQRRAAVAHQLRRLAIELADLDRQLDEIEQSER